MVDWLEIVNPEAIVRVDFSRVDLNADFSDRLLGCRYYGCSVARLYNRGRPHARLGPGLPERSPGLPAAPIVGQRLPGDVRVVARPILGGLHHEHGFEKLAA